MVMDYIFIDHGVFLSITLISDASMEEMSQVIVSLLDMFIPVSAMEP